MIPNKDKHRERSKQADRARKPTGCYYYDEGSPEAMGVYQSSRKHQVKKKKRRK